jgi:hypothetical protein
MMENNSPVSGDNTDIRLSAKELFEHLFKELSEVYERYKKYVYTATATQILIIGWFLTSNKGAEFVKSKYFFTAWLSVIVFFVFIEAVVGFYLRYRSKAIGDFIKALHFIEYKYYSFKIISFPMVMIVLLGRTVLYALMSVIIMSLYKNH